MIRIAPFFVLAAATLGGAWMLPTTDPTPDAPASPQDDVAVKVEAALERTALPASKAGRTFVRVALTGEDRAPDVARKPVSLTLIIDRSGSMSGAKMRSANDAAVRAIQTLQQGDLVSVVSFDTGAEVLAEHVRIGETPLEPVLSAVRALRGRGGTDMVAGLDVGRRLAVAAGDDYVGRVMLLSDGRPNTESGLDGLVTRMARRGVVTTTLGLGADYNEDLMARLADRGLGNYHFVEKGEQLAGIFAQELDGLSNVVARDVVVTLRPAPGVRIERVPGYEIEHMGSKGSRLHVGDLPAASTRDLLVEISHRAMRGGHDLVDVDVTWSDVARARSGAFARALGADFVDDKARIAAALVPEVAVKAEKVRTAEVYARANELSNKNDHAKAQALIDQQVQRLQAQAAVLHDEDLREEAEEMQRMQTRNADVSQRKVMNNAYKWKARSLNRYGK